MRTSTAGDRTSPRARRGASVAVAMGAMNVATYGFTMLAARVLGPSDYSAVAAFLATLMVCGVVQLGIQATAARRIAADHSHAAMVRHAVLRVTFGAALLLGCVFAALTPVVDTVLRLDDWRAALLVGLTLVPMTVLGGQLGILQGERRWHAVAWVYAANGVPRLLIGAAVMVVEPSAFAAMVAIAVAAVVPVVIAWAFLRHDPRGTKGEAEHSTGRVVVEVLHSSQALLAFFALSNVDVLIARNQLDAHEAGLYAGGVILVKAVLFLPQFVVVLAFPSLSTVGEQRRALGSGLVLVAAAGALCIVASGLLADVAMVFVGGAKYGEIRDSLWLFALLGTLLAMVQLLVYSVLAQQVRRAAIAVWLGLVALVALGLHATTWESLLLRVGLVDLAVCAVLFALTAWRLRRPESTQAQ
jgi:O-antigen/teichoic acid export membrane protein